MRGPCGYTRAQLLNAVGNYITPQNLGIAPGQVNGVTEVRFIMGNEVISFSAAEFALSAQ